MVTGILVVIGIIFTIFQVVSCVHMVEVAQNPAGLVEPSALTTSWENDEDAVHLYLRPVDSEGRILKAPSGEVISLNYLDKLADQSDTDELPILHLRQGTLTSQAKFMSVVGHLSDLNYRIITK